MGLIQGKCPNCGANLKICDTATGELMCPFCGGSYLVEKAVNVINNNVDNSVTNNNSFAGANVVINQTKDDADLESLYILARRAKDCDDSIEAEKYYSQIVVKDPNSWEAAFYSVYFKVRHCKIYELGNAAQKLYNSESTILELVKNKVSDADEQYEIISEIEEELNDISRLIFDNAINHYKEGDIDKGEAIHACCAARDVSLNLGDLIMYYFGDGDLGDYCVGDNVYDCWEIGMEMHGELKSLIEQQDLTDDVMKGYDDLANKYTDKIKKYYPEYQSPVVLYRLTSHKASVSQSPVTSNKEPVYQSPIKIDKTETVVQNKVRPKHKLRRIIKFLIVSVVVAVAVIEVAKYIWLYMQFI